MISSGFWIYNLYYINLSSLEAIVDYY